MTELSYELPEENKPDKTQDPKVTTALTKIKETINGKIGASNLEAEAVETAKIKNESVTELKLAEAVRNKLSPPSSGHSEITTEQSRENTAYGKLATPDEVEVIMPAHGIIVVTYQAQWKESAIGVARAAIFIGANQLKVANAQAGAVQTQAAATKGSGEPNVFCTLSSYVSGLVSYNPVGLAAGADVTTGQAVGFFTGTQLPAVEVGGTVSALSTGIPVGGSCVIFGLAAATYVISVQFKATSGSVTVKGRKLFAEARSN